jgi:3-oxoacyl-[acyl-carrier-protein] synthase-1
MTGKPRPHRIAPLGVQAHTVSCAAGVGLTELASAVREQRSGLRPNEDPAWPLATWVGRLDALADAPLLADLAEWDCRVTRLAWHALQVDAFAQTVRAACTRHGAARVGLVLGTSASTIGASEQAYRQLDGEGHFPSTHRNPRLNTPHAVADFVHTALHLGGPCVTISTACSSSAKAFAVAERWLRLGWVDAVVVGGVEALSASLLYGFRALGLLSAEVCKPFDARRQGISIGEAAGFALLARDPAELLLLGHGESNDAHHMSSPHPQGLGAEAALDDALARAGLAEAAVEFVNLHGTASAANDAVEAALVARRYATGVHACATKGLTGHTMGAAGMVEAALCLLALQGQGRAGSAHTAAADAAFGARFAGQLQMQPQAGAARVAASHSFGFGGNNAVLIFGREGSAT